MVKEVTRKFDKIKYENTPYSYAKGFYYSCMPTSYFHALVSKMYFLCHRNCKIKFEMV